MQSENSPDLESSLKRLADLTEKQIHQQRDWKLALRNGLLAGLGGVLGATVVVSILLFILQPFKRLEGLGPVLDRLDTTLKQSNRH